MGESSCHFRPTLLGNASLTEVTFFALKSRSWQPLQKGSRKKLLRSGRSCWKLLEGAASCHCFSVFDPFCPFGFPPFLNLLFGLNSTQQHLDCLLPIGSSLLVFFVLEIEYNLSQSSHLLQISEITTGPSHLASCITVTQHFAVCSLFFCVIELQAGSYFVSFLQTACFYAEPAATEF